MAETVRLFIFGLGYTATVFARAFADQAEAIAGTTRTTDRPAGRRTEGFETLVFDGIRPGGGVADALARSTHLLVSIAPGEIGDPVLAHHRTDILAAPNLRWIGYLSTVGVYGNYGGAWVSERTTPHPSPGRAANRLTAEKAWSALAAERGVPLGVFRIAGIYGPGRNALVNIADGTAHRVFKAGQVFNRIHVGDIAAVLGAAVATKAAGIYNLADDEPAPPQDVVAYAASLMGVPPPPEVAFDQANLSPMARSFYGENRRVLNRRIKTELVISFRYPSYREELAAMWSIGNWRG